MKQNTVDRSISINLQVALDHGFPAAVVLSIIQTEAKIETTEGWVQLSVDDFHALSRNTVGKSTVRDAINRLITNGYIEKGRPKKSDTHAMDRTCWYKLTKKKV